jgi:hypothetical protein
MAGWNKPDKKQHFLRIREVARLLCDGNSQYWIKKVICEKYQVHPRTVMNYIRHARNAMMECMQVTKREMRGRALEFYFRCMQDTEIQIGDKIKVQTRIDKILGLEEPTVVHQQVTGGTSNVIRVEYQDEWTQQRFNLDLDDTSASNN